MCIDSQDVNRAGARSPSPNLSGSLNPSLLKSVLLGKEVEDEFSPQERVRVSSISGRPVRQDGVGIVIGNESSSESEDEDDNRKCVCVCCTQHTGCALFRVNMHT